jgi:hypothetical protein
MFTRKRSGYCVKDVSGQIHAEGAIPATRLDLDLWMQTLSQPWIAAMEATIFTPRPTLTTVFHSIQFP